MKVPKQLLAPVRDLPLRQPCVWSPQRQWRLRSGASLATFGRPWTSIFCGSSPILLLTSAEGLGCAIHQIPKRDRRGGVTTLKCATAHGPCFLTGSHATKIISAAPFRAQSSPSVSTPQGARSAEIGSLERGCALVMAGLVSGHPSPRLDDHFRHRCLRPAPTSAARRFDQISSAALSES